VLEQSGEGGSGIDVGRLEVDPAGERIDRALAILKPVVPQLRKPSEQGGKLGLRACLIESFGLSSIGLLQLGEVRALHEHALDGFERALHGWVVRDRRFV
jgi:hypothetical protein